MTLVLILFFCSLLAGPLGGITIFSGVTVYLHDVILCALLVTGILTSGERKKYAPVLLYPILSFFGIGLLSLVVNYSRFTPIEIVQSSLYLWRWGAYALLYIILVRRLSQSSIIFGGLYGFGTALSVFGFVQYLLYPELRNLSYLGWDPHLYRLFSTLLDPNFTGIIIVLTLCSGMYLWSGTKKTWISLMQIINLVALYLTYSRSSHLALIIASVVYALYYKKWKMILCIALFIVALVYIPKPGGKTLLLSRMDSTISRIENWQDSLHIIEKSPILGNGFNTLRFIQKMPRPLADGELVSRARSGVDSSILFLLATTGILGLTSYGWIVWKTVNFFRQYKKLKDYSGVLLVSFVAVTVHSMFVNSLVYPWVMIWLWALLAAGEIRSQESKGN